MNKQVFRITLILGLQLSLAASAQPSESVSLSVPDFARGLVEQWVSDYHRTNPTVDFQFVTGKLQNPENTISLTIDAGDAIQVARLAVLPVTTKDSQAQQLVGQHALNAKRLQSLFFVSDEPDDEQPTSKLEQLHIITGNSRQSASRLYAAHFHQAVADFKGKKIQGDDSFLNLAVDRDPLGVTLNSLPNIFDLQSRQLRPQLALLPLDIDRQGRQVLSEGRLDDIIRLLEHKSYAEIPVSSVGLSYNHANRVLNDFVAWVLQRGVDIVNRYGLLSLSPKQLAAQQQRISQKELAQK